MKDIALAIDSEHCWGSARGWVGAHGWSAVGDEAAQREKTPLV